MKSLLEESEYKAICQRIENLKPDALRQWGKMDIGQMLAHCNYPLEMATGVAPLNDESNFISKTLIRWIVLGNIKKGACGKNLPTMKGAVVTDSKDFEKEKKRLLQNIDIFYEKGQNGSYGKHPAFGSFTNEQWGALQFTHLNHHLTQFSS